MMDYSHSFTKLKVCWISTNMHVYTVCDVNYGVILYTCIVFSSSFCRPQAAQLLSDKRRRKSLLRVITEDSS